MRGDLIETFWVVNFLIKVGMSSIFLFEMKIYNQERFQKLSPITTWNLVANKEIFFRTNGLFRLKTVIAFNYLIMNWKI